MSSHRGTLSNFDAVLFDLDGASHVDRQDPLEVLEDDVRRRPLPPSSGGEGAVPAVRHRADNKLYVDGKPRYEGVRGFLASRGISLPEGTPKDPPAADTVCGLGASARMRRKTAASADRVSGSDGDVVIPGLP